MKNKLLLVSVVIPVLALLLAGLTGCGNNASAQPETTAPAPTAAPTPSPAKVQPSTPTPPPSDSVANHGVLGLDVTTSMEQAFNSQAKDAIAAQVDGFVYPGQPGFKLYIRPINHESYSSKAHLQTIIVPKVSVTPASPPTKADFSQCNPYDLACRRRVEADNRKAAAGYENELAQHQADLDDAQSEVASQTKELRELILPVDNIGTDIFGFFCKAQELLPDGGERIIAAVTDLRAEGKQSQCPLSLPGVKVRILLYCVDDASACQQRRDEWASRLRDAGADVKFLDTSQGFSGLLK